MAKLDKLKKRVKQLGQQLEQQSVLLKQATKDIKLLKQALEQKSSLPKNKIKQLSHKLGEHNQAITELQKLFANREDAPSESCGNILLDNGENSNLALEQKNTWKRHTYLCERYDVYLISGHKKEKARTNANEDLVDKHGKEAGFTEEQLQEILS